MKERYVGYVEQSEMSSEYNEDTHKWETKVVHTQKRKVTSNDDWETKSIESSAVDATLKRSMSMALLTIETYMEKVGGSLFGESIVSLVESGKGEEEEEE